MDWIFGWQDVTALSLGVLGLALAYGLWRAHGKSGCAKCPIKKGVNNPVSTSSAEQFRPE